MRAPASARVVRLRRWIKFQGISRGAITKGRASYSMELESYEVVPPNVEKEIMSKYKGNTGDDED